MNSTALLRPLLPAALSLFATTLFAQSTNEIVALDTFTVTSQKRPQAVQDVPISVTPYAGAALRELGVTQYKDLAPFVPGFFVQEQSPNNPGINIRGVTTDSGDPRSETRVSLFQDGVSISRSRGSVVELFDLERVEVLKGPQGTLFGRGAEIGTVSLIQNKAKPDRETALTVGFGDFGFFEVEALVNQPVSDTLFARVAFRHASRDGFIDNLVDGSTLNGKDTTALRTAFRWLPSDRTTVDLILNFQVDNPPGTAFKSGAIPPPGGDTSPFTAAALTRGDDLSIDRAVYGATLLVTSDLTSAWSLTGITGWRAYDSMEQFDADGSIIPLLEFAEDAAGEQFSQEFRFDFDSGGAFVGFLGAGYFYEEGEQRVPLYGNEQHLWPFLSGNFRDGIIAAGIPAQVANAAIPTLNPLAPGTNLPATFAIFNNPAFGSLQGLAFLANAPLKTSHVEDYAVFGETSALDVFADGTYRLVDRLEFTAGLRATYEDITSGYEARNLSATPGTVGFILSASPNNAFRPTARRDVSDSYTGWVGRVAARFKLSDDLNTYATIARGRRPDSILLDATTTTFLTEEVVWNYEIGLKGVTADRRLTYGAAIFRYDYSNFQTTVADPTTLGRFINIDAGNATGQGLELTAQGLVTDTLRVFASYGYTDATFDDTGDNGQPQEYAGNNFRLTAKHTAALGLIWSLPTDVGTFTLSPVYQYKSEHFFDDDNAQFNFALRQGAFSLVNVRAGWLSPGGRYELAARVENVFAENYLIDAGNTGGSFGIPTFIAGNPRLWSLSGTVRF